MVAVVGSLAINLQADTNNIERALKATGMDITALERKANVNLGKMDRTFSSKFDNMARNAGRLGKAGIGSFFVGVGTGALAALAPLALFSKAMTDISETAALQRLADRIGLGVEQLQALQYGAVQAGVAVDQMGDGLGDFASKIAEAASGGGELAGIFEANGVELKDQDGTLRSTRDILGEFANLIQNAQTPAEQLFLAQQAFGDEAAKMVPLFKDGARGLDQLEANAKSAGAVIDADLVKRAEELDRRMQSMWAVFSARSKSAILTAVQAMDGLLAKLANYEQRKAAADAGTLVGSLVKPKGAVLTTGTGDKPTALDARMGGALVTELNDADQRLVEALKARYGDAAAKATVIPSSGSGDGKSGGIKESVDYAERLIENLEREKSLIGASALDIEKSNALWHAGTDATAEQREEIAGLVTAIYTARAAHELQTEAIEDARDAARDFAGTLVHGFLEGRDASEVLGDALGRLASRLADSGLDQLFGGSGFGSLLSGLFGGGSNYFPPAPSAPLPFIDSGGAMTSSGLVSFGPKTRMRHGLLQADSGFGPKNFLAALELGETVLTSSMVNRTTAAMSGLAGGLRGDSGGSPGMHITVGWSRTADGNLKPFVESVSQQTAGSTVSAYDKGLPDRINEINASPRRR